MTSQRQAVLFTVDDEKQWQHWSNLRTGFVPRGGISLKEKNDTTLAVVSQLPGIYFLRPRRQARSHLDGIRGAKCVSQD
jgi:hypothetical protein